MKKTIQAFVILDTAFLFSLWLLWNFNISKAFDTFNVSASNQAGVNLLKSQVGGTYLIFTVFVILYFVKKQNYWAQAAAISVGSVLATRTISLVMDGVTQYGLIAVANEILIIALLVVLFQNYE